MSAFAFREHQPSCSRTRRDGRTVHLHRWGVSTGGSPSHWMRTYIETPRARAIRNPRRRGPECFRFHPINERHETPARRSFSVRNYSSQTSMELPETRKSGGISSGWPSMDGDRMTDRPYRHRLRTFLELLHSGITLGRTSKDAEGFRMQVPDCKTSDPYRPAFHFHALV